MGARGPTPKRAAQRRRTNSPEAETVAVPAGGEVVLPPEPEEKWHPVARAWYESLGKSGQAVFYEPSDWATAYLLAESMSRELKPQFVGMQMGFDEQGRQTSDPVIETVAMKGASLSAYLKAMGALLVTEGDRRRAGVELVRSRPSSDEASDDVPNLDDYRSRLSG